MEEKTMEASESPSASWKLYHNPRFVTSSSSPSSSSSSSSTSNDSASMGGDDPLSELVLVRARIEELKVEVELERRMRRRIESLNCNLARDLSEERRAREAAESRCKKLKEELDGVMAEVEEERRMLRVAEVWREERVQMKLSEARIAMEEKIREMAALSGSNNSNNSNNNNNNSASGIGGGSNSSRAKGRQRREVENPHIKRGIKGFVEFPKAVKLRAGTGGRREGKGGQVVLNLECQKAQLRVLMRHSNSPGVGLSIGGATDNLVM